MSPKWFIGLLLLLIGCTLFSGLIEQTYLGDSTETVFGQLLFVDALTTGSVWENIKTFAVGVFSGPLTFLSALWSVFTFDYAMYQGDYVVIRYVMMAISTGVVISLTLTWVRGISSPG